MHAELGFSAFGNPRSKIAALRRLERRCVDAKRLLASYPYLEPTPSTYWACALCSANDAGASAYWSEYHVRHSCRRCCSAIQLAAFLGGIVTIDCKDAPKRGVEQALRYLRPSALSGRRLQCLPAAAARPSSRHNQRGSNKLRRRTSPLASGLRSVKNGTVSVGRGVACASDSLCTERERRRSSAPVCRPRANSGRAERLTRAPVPSQLRVIREPLNISSGSSASA